MVELREILEKTISSGKSIYVCLLITYFNTTWAGSVLWLNRGRDQFSIGQGTYVNQSLWTYKMNLGIFSSNTSIFVEINIVFWSLTGGEDLPHFSILGPRHLQGHIVCFKTIYFINGYMYVTIIRCTYFI